LTFLYNRLNTYQLHTEEYKQEENIIHNILHNNSFPIRPIKARMHKHNHTTPPPTQSPKWATFTYTGKETTYITNLFKQTNMKIAFRTRNSILNHLASHNHTQKAPYTSSGVYKLTCPDCSKAYLGQTGRSFLTRFKEHKQAAKNKSTSSNFAKHINEQAHTFGTTDNTMSVLKIQRKGPYLNTLERFYIHKEASLNNHLNDDHIVIPNRVFDTILKMQHPPPPAPPPDHSRKS
jgi:hypothetical protein